MSDDDFQEDYSDEDDEMEIEDANDPFSLHADPKKLKRSLSFEVLPQSEILNESKSLIEQTKTITGLSDSSAVAILLRKYKWNKEKVINDWIEDSDRVMTKAGLFFEPELVSPSTDLVECLICLDELPEKDMFGLGCGHRYCINCWRLYLENAIKQGSRSINTRCPAPKCPHIIHERHFQKFVDPKAFQQYSKFLLRSFVDDNPYIKWCPSAGCENAIHCERLTRKAPVVCSCGFCFCFRCADLEIGDHSPCSCEFLDKWRQKASFESENVKWMLANTKKCPQCRSPIEKNGGCMHMTCSNGNCAYEFCWMCRGAWSEHGTATGGWYQCNKYEEAKSKRQKQKNQNSVLLKREEDDDDENFKREEAKTELETYMFYYHRYESHMSAGKIAKVQLDQCELRRMEISKRFGVRDQDSTFLKEAVEQLILNRRVLRFSYVMAYYLDRQETKRLFEHSQEDLEKYTNELSELYEKSLDKISEEKSFGLWKEKVANHTRISAKYLKAFVEFCRNDPNLNG